MIKLFCYIFYMLLAGMTIVIPPAAIVIGAGYMIYKIFKRKKEK